MKSYWRYLATGVVVLLILLAVVLLSARSWLESESGRSLLQRELSKAMGLEADFRDEYSLELFPVIRIAGSDLALNDPGTGLAIASIDSYDLHLALRPLLRKEVNILKVEIHDGILDLDRLAEFNSSRANNTESDFQLPDIRDLQITGLQLQKSAVDFLLISELNLNDFAENQKSRIALDLALDRTTAASQSVHLEGVVQVTASPLKLNLLVEELSVHWSKQSWSIGRGELNWSADQQKLWGELRGTVAHYNSRYSFSVLYQDRLQVALSAELQSPDKESFALNLQARAASDSWLVEVVELNLDGQSLAGAGCFSTNDEPLLQLQLEAEKLDLDAVQDLIPKGLFPPDTDAEDKTTASTISEDPELPLQLAIALSVGQLRWSGTTARNVRLLIGAEPDCTSAEVSNSN